MTKEWNLLWLKRRIHHSETTGQAKPRCCSPCCEACGPNLRRNRPEKQRKIARIDDNGEELLAEKKNTEEKRRKWPTEPSTKGKLNAPKNHMIGVATEPPSMRVLKTADLGTQALLVVNSFKLHLTALNIIINPLTPVPPVTVRDALAFLHLLMSSLFTKIGRPE